MYIPIVFITDKNYLIQTATAIESIKQTKEKNTNVRCYLLSTRDSANEILALKSIEREDLTIDCIVTNEEILNGLPGAQEKYVAASKAALLKFSIPDLIKEDKIIYLDGDIIVKKDLSDLYSIDINNQYAAVVPDLPQVLYEKPLFDEGNGRAYFNTGVMLLNLEKFRKDNISEKLIRDKIQHADDLLMDQNSFNRVLGKKTRILPPIFNATVASLIRSRSKYNLLDLNTLFDTKYTSIEDIIENSYVIHYSSKDKPWIYFDTPEADAWINCFSKSIFSHLPLIRKSKLDKNVNFKKIDLLNGEDSIPVILSTNDKYVPNLIVTIYSVTQNSNTQNIIFYILHSGLSESSFKLIKEKLQNANITFINISNLLKENEKNLKTCGHFTAEMYYRWYIPEIFYQYNRVIYLDCDLVVQNDISELFNVNLNGKTFGAVINLQNKNKAKDRYIKLKCDYKHYINSGVLVIDNRKFIEKSLKEKLFKFVRENPKIDCPDQDALNAVALGDIEILSPLWNVQWHFQFISDKEKDNLHFEWKDYIQNLKNAKIIHFTSNIKPWNHKDLPYASVFTEIWNKLGLENKIIEKNFTQSKVTSSDEIRKLVKLLSNIFASDGRNRIAIQKICKDFNLTDYRNRLFIYAIKQKDISAASSLLCDIAENDKNSIRQMYVEKIKKINNSISMKITLPFRRFKNPNLTDVEPINSFNPKISHIGLNDNCCELLRILSVFFKETNVWKKGTSEYYPDYNKLTKEQKCFVMALRYNDISTAYIVLQNILGTKNYALHSQYQSQIDRIYKLKSMVFTRPIRTIKKLIK